MGQNPLRHPSNCPLPFLSSFKHPKGKGLFISVHPSTTKKSTTTHFLRFSLKMAARRLQHLQNWTNQNLFIGSFDSASFPNAPSVVNRQPKIEEEDGEGYEMEMQMENGGIGGQGQQLAKDTAEDWEAVGSGGAKKSITALQAAWNVMNAIQDMAIRMVQLVDRRTQVSVTGGGVYERKLNSTKKGMFIVGLPFAVKVGGWCALLALTGVAWICYRTGLALIDCLYEGEGSERKRVRNSYREVAEAVRPGLGKYVLAAQLTELASTCILYIVLAGDLLQGCFPSVDRPAWMMLTSVLLLGTAFLDDLRVVSHLSLANAVSHLAVNAVLVIYCFSQFSAWHLSSLPFVPNFRLFPTIIGVVVFGYTSHIFLPSLEGSMQDPSEFKQMLAFSHIAAAAFKALFGLIGFLTFAEFTQKEISNSLPNQAFKVLVNLCLVTKALLSYPLPYFAIVQLLADNFFRGIHVSPFPGCYGTDCRLREWALSLRILLILWTLWMALTVPYLVELMGLVGNITGTVLSFIWPAYFHLRLREAKLSPSERRFDKFVIAAGVATCVVGVIYSAAELLHAIRTGEEQERL